MTRWGGLLALVFLVGAACSDSEVSGSAADYCERLEEAESLGSDPDPAAVIEVYRDLEDLAPDDIRDSVATVRVATEGLSQANNDDPEALARFLTPEVLEAGEELRAFAEDECGASPDVLPVE
jgi:hypothetical protein